MNNENKELEERRKYWLSQGKQPEQITYGMLNNGFQSISGIPDDFCSAEDPADRERLWEERRPRKERDSYHEGEYRGYGDFRD
jgi:hypothetical protein